MAFGIDESALFREVSLIQCVLIERFHCTRQPLDQGHLTIWSKGVQILKVPLYIAFSYTVEYRSGTHELKTPVTRTLYRCTLHVYAFTHYFLCCIYLVEQCVLSESFILYFRIYKAIKG